MVEVSVQITANGISTAVNAIGYLFDSQWRLIFDCRHICDMTTSCQVEADEKI